MRVCTLEINFVNKKVVKIQSEKPSLKARLRQ